MSTKKSKQKEKIFIIEKRIRMGYYNRKDITKEVALILKKIIYHKDKNRYNIFS